MDSRVYSLLKRFSFFIVIGVFTAGLLVLNGNVSYARTIGDKSSADKISYGISSDGIKTGTRKKTKKKSKKKSHKNGWIRTKSGNKIYKRYYKNGVMSTGRTLIDGSYYFFKVNGLLMTGNFTYNDTSYYTDSEGRINAISYQGGYYYPNGRRMTDDDEYEYHCIDRAKEIVASITNEGMSQGDKLITCMRWVQSHPYKMYEGFLPTNNWPARYANRVFNDGGSDCHGDAAAFAYMALAIGYTDVYVCIDSDGYTGTAGGHSWAEINGLVYDPLFAEAKSFAGYYGVPYSSYELSAITHRKLPYMSQDNGSGRASIPKDGLVYNHKKDSYYFYKNGTAVKNTWKAFDGKKYYFQSNTRAVKNKSFKIKGKYYLFGEDAKLLTGKKIRLVTINDKKYRVDKKGRVIPGWSKNKKRYYDKTGKMITGRTRIKGKLFVFSKEGLLDRKATKALRKSKK